MMKELENFEHLSKFEQDLINLIFEANDKNLDKLRKAYPKLVEKFRRKKKNDI